MDKLPDNLSLGTRLVLSKLPIVMVAYTYGFGDLMSSLIMPIRRLCSVIDVSEQYADDDQCYCDFECDCYAKRQARKQAWIEKYRGCYTICRDCFFVDPKVEQCNQCNRCYYNRDNLETWRQPRYCTWKDIVESVKTYPFAMGGSDIWTCELRLVVQMPLKLVAKYILNQKNTYSIPRSIIQFKMVQGRDFPAEEKEMLKQLRYQQYIADKLQKCSITQ